MSGVALRPGRSVAEGRSRARDQIQKVLRADGRRGWRADAVWRHLSGEHGEVVEVALTSLLDGQREEEAAPVLGEQRHLPL